MTNEFTEGINALRSRYDQDVAAIEGAEDLSPEAKRERQRELTRDFMGAHNREKAEAEAALEQRYERLYRKAHGQEAPAGDPQSQMLGEMRRARVERDLLDEWDRRDAGPTVEEYEEALLRGDDIELGVYERLGKRRIGDSTRRQEYAERVERGRRERMPASRRQALEELENFEKERAHVGYVLSFTDSTTKAATRARR